MVQPIICCGEDVLVLPGGFWINLAIISRPHCSKDSSTMTGCKGIVVSSPY
jgi:hypothetical protein